MRSILRGTALGFLLLASFAAIARYTELVDRYFIYFPDRELVGTPADRGLEFQDVTFRASDGVMLHGWFVPGPGEVTWLWFHGNAGNISHRLDNIALLHRRLGVSLFIFDYRGYGRSEGSPSEKGLYKDAEAALAYLRTRSDIDQGKLVLFGRSLGCAVAVETATRNQPYAVILESPFTSSSAMAKRLYPFLPLRFLITNRFDSASKIARVHAPLMVVHGSDDRTVPIEVGRELFDAAGELKRFYVIEGADHNDTYVVGGEQYLSALEGFLQDPTAGHR